MGFENRDYYRDGRPDLSNPFARIGWWLLYGRVPLFTAWGIRVQAHSSLILAMGFMLLLMPAYYSWLDRVLAAGFLFLFVLLHEFGHCFGARAVGGEADEIVMHPLGGLALVRPPAYWRAHFIATAAGPAVNVVLAAACAGVLYFSNAGQVPLLPFFLSREPYFLAEGANATVTTWAYWAFQTNWMLLLFNLLPIFPLDGGRMLQELLWSRIGYYRSMLFACNTGMVGAIVGGMIAIATLHIGLLILALMGLLTCRAMKMQVKEVGPWGFEEYDNGLATAIQKEERRDRKREEKAARQRLIQRQRQADEDRQVDQVLAKISREGKASLTGHEKRILKLATEHKRERSRGTRS